MWPVCLLGIPIDKRISRQSGNFTIHGYQVLPIDFIEDTRNEIHKIFIPYDCIEEIKQWLDVLNLTHESILGDLNGDIVDLISDKITEEAEKSFD